MPALKRMFTLSDAAYLLSVQKEVDEKLMERLGISEEEWLSDYFDAVHGALFFSQKGKLIAAAEKKWNPLYSGSISRAEIINHSVDCLTSLLRIALKNDKGAEDVVSMLDEGLEALEGENFDAGFFAAFARIESYQMNIGCLHVLLSEFDLNRESFIAAFNKKTRKKIQ